jgi:WD40 repeat protein
LAQLAGHTSLICALHLSRDLQLLSAGGSDGRVITFSLVTDDDAEEASAEKTGDVTGSLPTPGEATGSILNTEMINLSRTSRYGERSRRRHQTRKRSTSRPPRVAYQPIHRIAAHDSSITGLQFDSRFLVTSGADGRARLWETQTGQYVRDLTDGGETVWKLGFSIPKAGGQVGGVSKMCAIMGKRGSKTVLELWGFEPKEGEEKGKVH